MTINEVCGSGLKAIILASQAIRLGDARTVVVGGTESMSQAPYLLPNQRWGSKLGDINTIDSLVHDGLTDAFDQQHMGITAETVAERFQVSREEQDAFALHSQQKRPALKNRLLQSRNCAYHPHRPQNQQKVVARMNISAKTPTIESLGKLRPPSKERHGDCRKRIRNQ